MTFLPAEIIAALGVMLVVIGLVMAWRSRIKKRGTGESRGCRSCGYNLTGNTSGRCPECGCIFAG